MPINLKQLEDIEKLAKEKLVHPKKQKFYIFYALMLNGKLIRVLKDKDEVNDHIEAYPDLIGQGHVYQTIKVPQTLRCVHCGHMLKFITVKGYFTYYKCISGHEHKYDSGGNLVG